MCLHSVFNLTNGVDVKETEERIATYKKENQDVIKKNKSKLVFHDHLVLAVVALKSNSMYALCCGFVVLQIHNVSHCCAANRIAAQLIAQQITCCALLCNNTHPHLFNGLFQYNLGESVPDGQTILYFTEAEMMGWQWHQLDHMQVICTSLQSPDR